MWRVGECRRSASPIDALCGDRGLWDRTSAVPMTVLSWLRLVGDVWFVGTHPDWPEAAAADPLVIEIEGARYTDQPIREYFAGDYELWQETKAESSDDPGETTQPFVSYLNKVFANGGFPGPVESPRAWRHRSRLAQRMLPL